MSTRQMACSIACSLLIAAACGARQRPSAARDIDRPAPHFGAAALDGSSARLSDFQGKVVILLLWAAWRCADELPGLDELAGRLPRERVAVVALSIDAEAKDFRRVVDSRSSWQLAFLHDPTGGVARAYDPGGFPAAYVIDARGVIRHAYHSVRVSDLNAIEKQAMALAEQPLAVQAPAAEVTDD